VGNLAAQGSAQNRLETRDLVIESAGGARPAIRVDIRAEIARTDEERSRGLMNRDALSDGRGMLFVFDRDQILSFWMKDTRIPLSIAYIAHDGRIIEIHTMKPLDTTPVHSARSVRYALEVPQGWFGRVGIAVGDYVLRLDELGF
jgi:uncharacterized membrane protein (UPF0127 family)